MNEKEKTTVKILERVKLKELKLIDASKILKLSYRQTKRKYSQYKLKRDVGVINKMRGKPSNNKISDDIKIKIIELYSTKYNGFGPTFSSEKMLEDENIKINQETLRLWLKKEGLWDRKRKRKKYRSRRERKESFGELIQIDGSHHLWFEERGDKCCYFNMIDDATNTDLGLFDKEERTVTNDYVVRYDNKYFQIIKKKGDSVYPRVKVLVVKWLDESIHLLYKNQELEFKEINDYKKMIV